MRLPNGRHCRPQIHIVYSWLKVKETLESYILRALWHKCLCLMHIPFSCGPDSHQNGTKMELAIPAFQLYFGRKSWTKTKGQADRICICFYFIMLITTFSMSKIDRRQILLRWLTHIWLKKSQNKCDRSFTFSRASLSHTYLLSFLVMNSKAGSSLLMDQNHVLMMSFSSFVFLLYILIC